MTAFDSQIAVHDGRVVIADGKVGTSDECCCCKIPCDVCAGAQANAVVTVAGGACAAMAGVYGFYDFYPAPRGCLWLWTHPDFDANGYVLAINARAAVRGFDSQIRLREWGDWRFRDDYPVPNDLCCLDGGNIEGAVDIPGVGPCVGSTATITFG